jgi:hypothetical protein
VCLMACATHPSVTPWIGVIANTLPSLSFTMKLSIENGIELFLTNNRTWPFAS